MVVRSPSPVVGEGGGLPGVEDLEEAGEEEWPPEHSSFVSNRVSFWELGPIPVGSVITFLQDPEEEGPIPAIIAVVVTGSESQALKSLGYGGCIPYKELSAAATNITQPSTQAD